MARSNVVETQMNGLDASQIEQLKQISDHLRTERQARSISLEEIAVKTYIPLRLLQALDQGEVERLPEPIFIQGFIRRYADMVGLDGANLAKTFNANPSPLVSTMPELEPVKIVRSVDYAVEKQAKEPRALPKLNHKLLAAILTGLGVLGLGAAAIALFNLNKPKLATNLGSKPAITNNETTKRSSAKPEVSPRSTQATPIQVAVNLVDDSWVEVVVDGKPDFEGTLSKGDKRTWKAQKSLVLRSGNAAAVLVSYNQGQAKPLGEPGTIREISFPPPAVPPN
jgi:cytoskeletal protein RodZ